MLWDAGFGSNICRQFGRRLLSCHQSLHATIGFTPHVITVINISQGDYKFSPTFQILYKGDIMVRGSTHLYNTHFSLHSPHSRRGRDIWTLTWHWMSGKQRGGSGYIASALSSESDQERKGNWDSEFLKYGWGALWHALIGLSRKILEIGETSQDWCRKRGTLVDKKKKINK